MAIVITSTTSSQEQLDHATSENWREPFEEPAPKPVPTAEPEEELAETPAKEAEPEAKETEERPKRKGGYQRKIERLEREISQLRAGKSMGEQAQTVTESVAQTPANTGEPKWNDYQATGKTIEQWQTDHTRWLWAEEQAKAIAAKRQERVQANKEAFLEGLEVLKKRPDFEDVLQMAGKITIPVNEQFLERLGPDIVFYLAQHPDLANEIAEMDSEDAAIEITKLAGRLESSPARTKNNKVRGTPPPPITPVNGAATVNSVPPDEMKMKDFIKWREENGGRRR